MKPPLAGPSPVGSVLDAVLKRVDPEQELRAFDIWTFWNAEVGEVIARRAQPARFRNGILFVSVATHSWMQELQFLKDDIRARLNTRLGAELVRDIFFVSGGADTSTTTTPEAPPDTGASAELAASPLIVLPPIADADLANAFARVVEARARRVARERARRSRGPHKPR
jgi:Dna[CI] antecedent DciA-like protein